MLILKHIWTCHMKWGYLDYHHHYHYLGEEFVEFWMRLRVHRDFKQRHKEVLYHLLEVVYNLLGFVNITRRK